MKFNSADRVVLLKCYVAEGGRADIDLAKSQLAKDIRQLEEAADVTTYQLCDADCRRIIRGLPRKTAISRLGREVWLSGLVRSAFHWDAVRQTADKKNYVLFDSSRLFK